ncbi:hypothetical protein [Aeromicrobium fastidiosum]|uniref:Uncharacterized protein n=1 Tax=Aeromicrobium fastidiosum TaxID=52699 RepID=A0A641AQ01_9ACTN|nr:hypothetical protein [Aeromicrobium fastidiosum]KAA1380015.1 hypothetical protein ESP62_002075 [Aeromicrobium fastidiosum]MBP2389538.1 hypothetical protein [Aeromicrobium fastidiosum]
MQPNKAVSRWGFMASLVTAALVLATVSVAFIGFAVIAGTGGTEDGTMREHACVTIGSDDRMTEDDFARDGSLLRATDRETVCRPYDALGHPRLVQALVDVRPLPIVLAALACLIGLRRVVEGTRDDGPFSTEAVHRLRRLRPWATAYALAGATVYWALGGVANDVVADASWPSDVGLFWPAIGTYVAFTIGVAVFDLGTSQRMDAHERGRSSAGDA